MDGPEIAIHLADASTQVLITGAGDGTQGWRDETVIMPMKLGEE